MLSGAAAGFGVCARTDAGRLGEKEHQNFKGCARQCRTQPRDKNQMMCEAGRKGFRDPITQMYKLILRLCLSTQAGEACWGRHTGRRQESFEAACLMSHSGLQGLWGYEHLPATSFRL